MSNIQKQSNAFPLSWSFKARLKDSSVMDCTKVPWQTLNKIKEQIAFIGIFYDGKYYGTVEFSSPEQRLIFIKRTQQDVDQNYRSVGNKRIIWLIGWQSTVAGVNVKTIMELHEDGSMVLKNNNGRR